MLSLVKQISAMGAVPQGMGDGDRWYTSSPTCSWTACPPVRPGLKPRDHRGSAGLSHCVQIPAAPHLQAEHILSTSWGEGGRLVKFRLSDNTFFHRQCRHTDPPRVVYKGKRVGEDEWSKPPKYTCFQYGKWTETVILHCIILIILGPTSPYWATKIKFKCADGRKQKHPQKPLE